MELTYETLAAFPRPGQAVPMAPRFSADGRWVYFLWDEERSGRLSLYRLELIAGVPERVAEAPADSAELTLEEQLARERGRVAWEGITQYQLQGETILIPYQGALWLKEGHLAPLRPIPDSQGLFDPYLLADQETGIACKDGTLVRWHRSRGLLDTLTPPAEEGLSYGVAEYVAQEELDRRRGYWVSPHEQWLVFTEVDERQVAPYPIVHQEAEPVTVEWHRYPFTGRENARVRLWVRNFQDESEPMRPLGWAPIDRYLLDILWLTDDEVAILSISRDARDLQWERWHVRSGEHRTIYRETDPRWINRPPQSWVLTSGDILTTTERTGYRQLLRIAPTGETRVYVLPELITELAGVDESAGRVYLVVVRQQSLERTLVSLDLGSGRVQEWTREPGWHRVWVSPVGPWFLDQWSTFDHAPVTRLMSFGDDRPARMIHANPITREDLGLATPERVAVVTGSVVLNGLFYAPSTPGPWPLVVSVYGGPHAQMVRHDWEETIDLTAQFLVRKGYAVWKLDGRGSAFRGVAFEQSLFHQFGTVELEDQVTGVQWVLQHYPVDARRIGIMGWSYGGYMTIRALLQAPDLFKVGVAGAPVTDFRWYDTAYTERYMGTPEENPDGYRQASLLPDVGALKGHLLLMHGLIDENVHFRHTVRLLQAFIDAGKDIDLVLLPGSRHMPRGWTTTVYRIRRTIEYFLTHL